MRAIPLPAFRTALRALIIAAVALATLVPGRPSAARDDAYTLDLPLSELRARQDAILSDLRGILRPRAPGAVLSAAVDADLTFNLQGSALEALVGCEAMNLRAFRPAGSGPRDWHSRWKPLFDHESRVTARGVFRIWGDAVANTAGEGGGAAVTSRLARLSPLTALAYGEVTDDLRAGIAPMRSAGQQPSEVDARQWSALLSHTLVARRLRKRHSGTLRLDLPELGDPHWLLRLQVADAPEAAPNGHRFTCRVVTSTRVFSESTRCFTVEGTRADRDAAGVRPGQVLRVAAIGRIDLGRLLAADRYDGPVPVELCVVGFNPPQRSEPVARARQPRPAAAPRSQAGARPAPAAPVARLVWVSDASRTFWRPGSRGYGTTRGGRYMAEQEAIHRGYRVAVTPPVTHPPAPAPPTPALPASRPPAAAAVRKELGAVYARYARACNKKDFKTLASLTTPDYSAVLDERPLNRPEALAALKQALQVPAGTSWKISIDRIEPSGSGAVAWIKEEVTGRSFAARTFWEHSWVKTPKGWRLRLASRRFVGFIQPAQSSEAR